MRTKANELFVGISVTLATLIVVVGILFLERSSLFNRGLLLDLRVEEADGLGKGDEVLFRGVSVGVVQDTRFERDGVVAQMKLDGSIPIPEDSQFVIRTIDLFGGKAVEIRPGVSDRLLESGSRVEGMTDLGILGMARGVEEVRGRIDRVLADVDLLLSEQAIAELHGLVQGLNAGVAENRRGVAEAIRNLNRLGSAATDIESITGDILSGKGTLGLVLNDEGLYEDLRATLAELRELIRDVREHPERYLTVEIF
jgi:phospholipid/cholesterol/gamma-HCH transport system substrate-binding protein